MSKGGFRDLLVWSKAKRLAIEVYRRTGEGSLGKDFALRDQLRRAAISVCSNIAEGDERDTDREAVRYFYIAKGSVAELIAQLEIAEGVGYLSGEEYERLEAVADEVSRMLRGLIRARSETGRTRG
jgi:four helix bundle protein